MASSSDHPRRLANTAQPATSSIPPAPPLPPPRPPQTTARSAFARFVQPFSAYGTSRLATGYTAGTRDAGGKTQTARAKIPGFNPHAPQHTSFKTKTGSEIAALDINQERTHCVVAGREVLETIRVAGTSCVEETNIRAAIINNDRQNSARPRENLDVHDVKWSHSAYNSTLATAATNGKVIIYDLNRPGIEVARLHEHHRQVHKVAFNPHHGALLLSGSQDATVKLWDLREMRTDVMTCRSRTRFMGQSDGVRDVKWSPTDVLEFAFGTDNGVVQSWDSRFPKSAKLKMNAHDGRCTSIDWHPDGKHLLSAGQDKNLKVWDFSSEQRRQKPGWTLRTPFPIAIARWRPACWSGDDHGQGTWQCSQVITSYERNSNITINLWDFRRPCMPFREMSTSTSAPSDMLWQSTDLLWSVGRDGTFYQTDVKFTAKTIDRRPPTTFAISPHGELVVFQQKRARRPGSEFDCAIPSPAFSGIKGNRETDLARSSADDSIDDSFLSSSYQKERHHERMLSNRSSKSAIRTPPTLLEAGVATLNETLTENKRTILPRQTAFKGSMEGIPNPQHFSYLAQKYKTKALPDDPTVDDYLNVHKAFEKNAKYASRASASRVAQTWRLFGTVLRKELMQRASHNRRRRYGLIEPELDPMMVLPKVLESTKEQYERQRALARKGSGMRRLPSKNEMKVQENSSNQPTPIARPVHNSAHELAQRSIPDLDHAEDLFLSADTRSRGPLGEESTFQSPEEAVLDEMKESGAVSEVPQWFSSVDHLEERKAMMSNYRAPVKQPLDLETPSKQTSSAIDIPPSLDRHNSNESFAMFSASSGSKGAQSFPASFSSLRKQSMSSIPENMQAAETHSFAYQSRGLESTIPAAMESSESSSLQMFEPSLDTRNTLSTQAFDCSDNGDHMEQSGTIMPEEISQLAVPPPQPVAQSTPIKAKDGDSSKQNPDSVFELPNPSINWKERAKSLFGDRTPTTEEVDGLPYIVDDFTDVQWKLDDTGYPVTVGKLLEEIFNYSTRPLPDSQHVFHFIALLKPFLPGSIVVPTALQDTLGVTRIDEAKKLLEIYANYCLNQLNLTVDDTVEILADPLAHLVRFKIIPGQIEAACCTYETQLRRARLYDPLVRLRTICSASFGSFREDNLVDSKIGLFCVSCDKPIRNQNGKCDGCDKRADPCPVCWQKYSPFVVTKRHRREVEALAAKAAAAADDNPGPTVDSPMEWPRLWQTCLSCGHGCHAACMSFLQEKSDTAGCCPLPGCGCPCLPGAYRDRVIREEEDEKARLSAGSVRADERRISESGAVKGVRGILDESKRVRVVEPAK